MHRRRSVLAVLCAFVALLVTACAGASAAPLETRAERTPGAATPAAPSGQAPGTGTPPDDDLPAWQLAPQWALQPELLQGSRRFRELARKGTPTPGEPTNVVLITTDDMTASDLRWMPKTRALVGGPGVSFPDSISPHPLCCPARAQILTGQFAQNNGVRSNSGPVGGYDALDSTNTLPVWLQRAGYQTAFMGKYLNGYGGDDPREVPPGWEHWNATVKRGVYDFYDFHTNTDGVLRQHHGVYQTEWFADRTEQLIPEMAAQDRPFFLWQSHLAPHAACPSTTRNNLTECWLPPTPSIHYEGVYDDVTPPQRRDPSYDEEDVSDKPAYIRSRDPLSPARERELTELFQRRIESLRSVDDAVARTVDALEQAGVLDETLLIFTSDNGYLLGEHRYEAKTVPYEPSLRVPLLMRGPSVPAGERRPATVGTLDLAPTILAAMGAEAGLPVDGRNLLPVARGTRPGWETVLIQGGPRRGGLEWFYRGVRTDRYTYVEYRRTGEVELYDRRRDPFQLRNLADRPAYAAARTELQDRLLRLQDCAGADCRQTFGPVPGPRPRAR